MGLTVAEEASVRNVPRYVVRLTRAGIDIRRCPRSALLSLDHAGIRVLSAATLVGVVSRGAEHIVRLVKAEDHSVIATDLGTWKVRAGRSGGRSLLVRCDGSLEVGNALK